MTSVRAVPPTGERCRTGGRGAMSQGDHEETLESWNLQDVIDGVAAILGAPLDDLERSEHRHLICLARKMDGGRGREDPVRSILGRIGDKWCTIIVLIIRRSTYRVATLRKIVSVISGTPISRRILMLKLRALERDGFVMRHVDGSVMPQVSYSLTPMGLGLHDKIYDLIYWIEGLGPQMEEARRAFDKRP